MLEQEAALEEAEPPAQVGGVGGSLRDPQQRALAPRPSVRRESWAGGRGGFWSLHRLLLTPPTKADAEEEKEPKLRDTPEDISFEASANTIAFHPSRDIIAAGDVDGDVYL